MRTNLQPALGGQGFRVNRREVLSAALVAGLATGSAQARPSQPIVETVHGRLKGLREAGVAVFRGIAYAASTGGANRFRPPQPVEPWAGVRAADKYGNSAPQLPYESSLRGGFSEMEAIGEDCLSLNVYASRASHGVRSPVMVWLHGGGWRVGSGSSLALRGTRLAHEGGVVLVTINHRIDVLGFLKIGDGDERFADAGNCGTLDMIAALRWVRDNIAAFGGDPGNVTIFGQSGGGSKVAALLAAPAAKGLFHKAIAMSCSGCLRITGQAEADRIAAAVARKLGLSALTGEALQQVPLVAQVAAGGGVHRPLLDGRTFARHPFDPDAPMTAVGIPLLAGNVASETRLNMAGADPAIFNLDETEVVRRLVRYLGMDEARVREILAAYRMDYPADAPGDLLGAITADYSYVRNTRRLADLQSGQAPVHTYLFERKSPVKGGLLRTPHESDVPFVFGTTAAAKWLVGGGPDIEALTRLMIRTWSNFAHTGSPVSRLLPDWPKHRAGSDAGMLIGEQTHFGRLPGAEARATLADLPIYEYSMPSDYLRA